MGQKKPGSVKLDPSIVRKIEDMRSKGVGVREVARRLGLHHSTVSKYSAPVHSEGSKPVAKGGPPPESRPGTVLNKLEVDGTIDVLNMDRPAKLEELIEICGVDTKKWKPMFYHENIWQGFYKLKRFFPKEVVQQIFDMAVEGKTIDEVMRMINSSEHGHRKVPLYQSSVSFKRVVEPGIESAMKDFVQSVMGAKPPPKVVSKKRLTGKGFVVSWGLWDAHLGMHAWRDEVGEDFDLSIAKRRVLNSIDDMVEELSLYEIERVWMPIGNDYMHFDSVRNKTTFGDHSLDVDTRYKKVFAVGLECQVYMIERALEICDSIDGFYVPGNHDYTSSLAMCFALQAWFRNDPRVKFDLSANPRKYRCHGGTLIGYDHGKNVKPQSYQLLMCTEAANICPRPTYREFQIGHRHQKWEQQYEGVTPTNGVLVRMNPALTNVDKWHHDAAFIGDPTKSVEAWRYNRFGYVGSHVTWARDDARD